MFCAFLWEIEDKMKRKMEQWFSSSFKPNTKFIKFSKHEWRIWNCTDVKQEMKRFVMNSIFKKISMLMRRNMMKLEVNQMRFTHSSIFYKKPSLISFLQKNNGMFIYIHSWNKFLFYFSKNILEEKPKLFFSFAFEVFMLGFFSNGSDYNFRI